MTQTATIVRPEPRPRQLARAGAAIDVALCLTVWTATFLLVLWTPLGTGVPGVAFGLATTLAALTVTPTIRAVTTRRAPVDALRAAATTLGLHRRPRVRDIIQVLFWMAAVTIIASSLATRIGHRAYSPTRATENTTAAGDVTALAISITASIIVAGIGEELLRAGLAQRLGAITGQDRPLWALLAATAVWVTGHLDYTLTGIAVVAAIGVTITHWYRRTGNLWTVIAAHAAWDTTMAIIIYLGH